MLHLAGGMLDHQPLEMDPEIQNETKPDKLGKMTNRQHLVLLQDALAKHMNNVPDKNDNDQTKSHLAPKTKPCFVGLGCQDLVKPVCQ